MFIALNGKSLSIPDHATLMTAVRSLPALKQINLDSFMVCLNDEVISRGQWETVVLKADDCIEVVRIVGGG